MSQQLPRIDLPDLLFSEIMGAAEKNKRTLADEVISRLWQTPILTAALGRKEGETDLPTFFRYILEESHQNLKPTDLQQEYIRALAGVKSSYSGKGLSKDQQAL